MITEEEYLKALEVVNAYLLSHEVLLKFSEKCDNGYRISIGDSVWIDLDPDQGEYNVFLRQEYEGSLDTILLPISIKTIGELRSLYLSCSGKQLYPITAS